MAKKKLVKGLWSKSEVSLLKKLFPNNPTAKVAAKFLDISRFGKDYVVYVQIVLK